MRGVDVEIEFIPQPRENVIRIDATVLVESESRKGILIGAAGRIIKSIGVTARYPIEREPASRVHHEQAGPCLPALARRRGRARPVRD